MLQFTTDVMFVIRWSGASGVWMGNKYGLFLDYCFSFFYSFGKFMRVCIAKGTPLAPLFSFVLLSSDKTSTLHDKDLLAVSSGIYQQNIALHPNERRQYGVF